jgi:hypothetical protein
METIHAWRSTNGELLHIGKDWEYNIQQAEVYDELGNPQVDASGALMHTQVEMNPLPEGSVCAEETGEWVEGVWVPEHELWAVKRKAEYGTMAEQLELLFDKGEAGWRQHIEAVKARYPKFEVAPPKTKRTRKKTTHDEAPKP